jgi:membrane protease YdiL (CAAX protease family)
MLPEKPWKVDAVLRLVARVLICIFIGTLVASAIAFLRQPQRPHAAGFLSLTAGACGLFVGAFVVLGRPWRLETFVRSFVGLLLCFYGALLLTWWSVHVGGDAPEGKASVLNVLIAVLSFQGATCVLVSRFLREHAIGWADAFGLKVDWRRALVFGAFGAVAFLGAGLLLQSASVRIMERLHLEPKEQTVVEVLRTSGTLWNRVVLGVTAIVLAPLAEELLFRGILYPAIKQSGHPRAALWGTSLAFAAIHLNLATFLPLLLLALILTWLYETTGNLLAPIAAHSLFNTMNFVLLYVAESLHLVSARP